MQAGGVGEPVEHIHITGKLRHEKVIAAFLGAFPQAQVIDFGQIGAQVDELQAADDAGLQQLIGFLPTGVKAARQVDQHGLFAAGFGNGARIFESAG